MKAFWKESWFDFEKSQFDRIKRSIASRQKTYLLSVDEDDFIEYVYRQFALEPLKILTETEYIGEPQKRIEEVPDWRGIDYQREVYMFTVRYDFTGTADLFKIQPSTYCLRTYDISVNEMCNTVSFSLKIVEKSPAEFCSSKQRAFDAAFGNMDYLQKDVNNYMQGLRAKIGDYFRRLKSELQSENQFFEAIHVKMNEEGSSVFSVPAIKKKIIPQIPRASKREYASSPTMSKEMYEDVLGAIYNLGKSIEKKPSLYEGKDEEALRDQFVLMLETRYESITSTGETFNKQGKTDLLLKYADDGTNIFIAECKIWKGAKHYGAALNQLFDRYLTWRDSKVAVILFVRNKDFTSVLTEIRSATQAHPYYVRDAGQRGESSFSYIFHLRDDVAKEVYLEVIAFHYV